MKRITVILLIAALVLSLCACNGVVQPPVETDGTTAVPESDDVNTDKAENVSQTNAESDTETDDTSKEDQGESTAEATEMKITIKAGEHTITATLYDNAAGCALWNKLPLTLPMMNLYGREMVTALEPEDSLTMMRRISVMRSATFPTGRLREVW